MKGFYPIWAWLSWDPDIPNKLSFPLPMDPAHEIKLLLTKRFRRKHLKLVDEQTDGLTTEVLVCLELTSELLAQVSLKYIIIPAAFDRYFDQGLQNLCLL